jgi:hypothetical protein
MTPVDVVLVDMPQMLHDIIREQIADAPGLRVVADLGDAETLDELVAKRAADVVIAGVDVLDDAHVDRLLATRPGLTVLTLDREGRETVLSRLRPHRERLGELSPERLLDVVRSTRSPAESPC